MLDKSFEDLRTLDLELPLLWPREFCDKSDRIYSLLSQSAVEEAVRKKLPKISGRTSVTVSVEHDFK